MVGLYVSGMSTRDIAAHLHQRRLWLRLGRDTISRVTGLVLEAVAEWRNRPLEHVIRCHFGALTAKDSPDRSVRTRASNLTVGVTRDGDREALEISSQDTEGAKVLADRARRLHRRASQTS